MKNKLETNGIIGKLIINGKDISDSVCEYEINQKAGELPKVMIKATPKNIDLILEELNEVVVVKENK